MSKDDNESPRTTDDRSGLAWIIALAVLPLLYILSIGPAAAICKGHPETYDFLDKIYRPLVWLHNHTPLRMPLEWWVELWEK